ncbi:MAG: hypothetical protein FJ279_24835 [Planctomycetes bacterium]|nr:hypothetical protein [Planctomycetota bacterium]
MPTKPNLLFIFTDEQRFDTMACYGNSHIRTPNLNALADQSFVFEHAYVSQPVCTPSRATLMTGLYPHTCGCTANNIPLRPETKTLAERVSPDYVRAYYGKWHLGDEVIPQHGFERWVSIEDCYRGCYSKPEYLSRFSDYHHFLIQNGFTPSAPVQGGAVFPRLMAAKLEERFTKAAFLGREAAQFIRENRERPFVLYVNFLEPHMPYTGPFDALYPPAELPSGPHFWQPPPPNASLLHRLMAARYRGGKVKTEAEARQMRACYMGNVTLVDRAVGVILGALDECGLSDSTITVFTSEHGDMMGDHGIFAKCVLYEEALKVPLLVRVPWLGKRQQFIRGRLNQVDLVPTLLELLGQPIPNGLDGESRARVLRGETSLERNDVFIEWNGTNGFPIRGAGGVSDEDWQRIASPWRTVISSDGWKLNLSATDQCELYDLNADPHEQQNLFDDPTQRERIRDLAARIRLWQSRFRDTVLLPPSADGGGVGRGSKLGWTE